MLGGSRLQLGEVTRFVELWSKSNLEWASGYLILLIKGLFPLQEFLHITLEAR